MESPGYTVGILSLGCPRNLVDSEEILARLSLKGQRIVDINKADVAIINTCAFIKEAKEESIEAILDLAELKKKGQLKKIIVCGCLSQRYRDVLRKELPEVDAFIGSLALSGEAIRYPITPAHFAYLKICEGCINNCSFCVIPRIKGSFRSLDVESILKKTTLFNKQRISELNIIGQDISAYGLDLYGRASLEGLLKKVVEKSPLIGWIRLLYLYPERVSDDLLKLIKDTPQICKYIDLPIQHINSRILKLMNRRMSPSDIFRLLERVRRIIPKAAVRTSLIVGFPSETDAEFKELLNFIEEAGFERLGAFIYSREEDTTAYNLKGQVSQAVKEERFDAVMSLQQKVSGELNRRFLGKTIKVLVDQPEGKGYLGRTQYDAPEVDGAVHLVSKKRLKAGDFVEAEINDTLEYDLKGEAV